MAKYNISDGERRYEEAAEEMYDELYRDDGIFIFRSRVNNDIDDITVNISFKGTSISFDLSPEKFQALLKGMSEADKALELLDEREK